MGCVLSKQFLQRKINPEQEAPTEKQQDEENCKEGEVQSVLSETNDATNQQEAPCDQKSSYQQLVNAWQSKDQDQVQESKHLNEQNSPSRTPTGQPTGLDDQNGLGHLYDHFLPNQPLFKDSFEVEDDKKQVQCREPVTSCPSYASPDNEEQIRCKQVQNLQYEPNMLDTEHEKQNQQGQICEQRPTFMPDNPRLSELEKGSKPEPINERRVPPGSNMSTCQKSELEKEKQLEKEFYEDPSFQQNTSQQNELEKRNNSSKMLDRQSPTQGSGCRGQNKELIEGNHSGIRHEKITSSEPNTRQRNGPENITNSSEAPRVEISTQLDTLILKKSELEEEQLSQGISQRPSSKSNTLNCSDIASEQESLFQQSKSNTENNTKPGKIFDEDILPSGTSSKQQGELEYDQQTFQLQIYQQCEPLRNEQIPEDLSEEGPSRAPQSSLPGNQDAEVQPYQDRASPETPLTGQKIRIQLPEAWLPMPNPEDSFHTVRLFPDSHEFEEAMKHLESTNGKFTVEKIERVQNPELYHRYMRRKKEMSETNGGTNEMHLFHAADNTSMPAIMEHGFSRKSCCVQRKAYGRGLYFYKDAFYSIEYTGCRDVRYLYLAQVLVGQYCQGNSLMILPPPKQPSIPECLYESVVDNTANPNIFVVFYGAQCYPEYLITIK